MLEQESNTASAALYQELSNSRNGPRRANAAKIKAVCDQMEQDQIEITPSGVIKRCHRLYEGTPAGSTITNTGSQLGEYIRRRRVEQHVPHKARAAPETLSLSEKIGDPVVANQVQLMEDSLGLLRTENIAFRALFKELGVDIDALLKGATKKPGLTMPEPMQSSTDANVSEIRSVLIKLMDHLATRQYVWFRGRLAVNAKEVLNKDEFSTFRQATGLSETQWEQRYGAAQ